MPKRPASATHPTHRDLARARRAWEKIRVEHGLKARIARAIGSSRQAVNQWPYIPEQYVLVVQRVARIPCYKLRPDLYKRESVRPLERAAA